eukprot:7416849-Prorocentrum_lima.AAC.1
MTSSLVGSEMCIRDRTMIQHGQQWKPTDRPHRRKRADINAGLLYARAVSYTHLTLPTICSV